MKTVSLISFIRNSVEDDYAMKVFYNIVKDSFVNNAAFLKSWRQVPESLKSWGQVPES
jgi:hypothetical protein